jgi:hypothetical protein
MRWIRRVLVGVGILAAVVLGIYALYQFLRNRWPIALFVCYAMGAALTAILGLVQLYRLRVAPDANSVTIRMATDIRRRASSRLHRARSISSRILSFVGGILGWPGIVAMGIKRSVVTKRDLGMREIASLSALSADTLTMAPYLMAAAIVLAFVAATSYSSATPAAALFARCGVAYFSILCFELTLSPSNLPERVRRASGKPFVRTLLLAAATGTGLVFGYAILEEKAADAVNSVRVAAAGLYSQLDSVKQIVKGDNIPPLTLCEGLSGALFVSVIVMGLFSFNEFARKDADFVAIADAKLELGDVSGALVALRQVREANASSLHSEAVALVGVGEYQKALEVWRRRTELGQGRSGVLDDQPSLLIQVIAAYPIAPPFHLGLLRIFLRTRPAQSRVILAMASLVAFKRLTPQSAIEELDREGLLPQYPLVHGLLLLEAGALDDARRVVGAVPESEDPVEFTREYVLLSAAVRGPTTKAQDRATIEKWCETSLPKLSRILPKLSDAADVLIAMRAITVLESLAKAHDSTHIEPLRFLAILLTERARGILPDRNAAEAMIGELVPPRIGNPGL